MSNIPSFIETQFPTSISYGARGGACFSTDITTSFTGYEQRNINWNKSRAKYNISLNNKTKSEIETIINFFYNVYGKAIGFRFKDWLDFKSNSNEYIATADGVKSSFQLTKTYKVYNSNLNYVREIKKPVNNEYFKIYLTLNNTKNQQSINTDFTIDFTTGIITFKTSPPVETIITSDFEFDIPVRFDTDELNISSDDFNASSWSSVGLIELRI